MFFSSFESLLRIVVVALGSYIGLVILLRISGNRTLSKMNSFDLIVTIALGSTLSSGILQRSVPLSETLIAFASLIFFQYAVTWLSVRYGWLNSLIKSEPSLVYKNGKFLKSAMQKSRVTQDEILSAIREKGFDSLDQVDMVVLETNGNLSATGKIGIQDFKPASGNLNQSFQS